MRPSDVMTETMSEAVSYGNFDNSIFRQLINAHTKPWPSAQSTGQAALSK